MSRTILPPEVWEKIWDQVDADGLESAQNASPAWNRIVLAYVASGRVRNRARVCERLRLDSAGSAHLDHRRGISRGRLDLRERVTAPLWKVKETNSILVFSPINPNIFLPIS